MAPEVDFDKLQQAISSSIGESIEKTTEKMSELFASKAQPSPEPQAQPAAPPTITEATGKRMCEGIECLKEDFAKSVSDIKDALMSKLSPAEPEPVAPQPAQPTKLEPPAPRTARDFEADADAIAEEMFCEDHGPPLKRAILKKFRRAFPNLVLRSRRAVERETEQVTKKIRGEIDATRKAEESASSGAGENKDQVETQTISPNGGSGADRKAEAVGSSTSEVGPGETQSGHGNEARENVDEPRSGSGTGAGANAGDAASGPTATATASAGPAQPAQPTDIPDGCTIGPDGKLSCLHGI